MKLRYFYSFVAANQTYAITFCQGFVVAIQTAAILILPNLSHQPNTLFCHVLWQATHVAGIPVLRPGVGVKHSQPPGFYIGQVSTNDVRLSVMEIRH